MNIQEFYTTSPISKKLKEAKSSLNNSIGERMSSIDPNRERLSKLINECDQHDNEIRTKLTTLTEDMQKYRLEQKQYDLIRDTLKEVDIANAHRLERLYKY